MLEKCISPISCLLTLELLYSFTTLPVFIEKKKLIISVSCRYCMRWGLLPPKKPRESAWKKLYIQVTSTKECCSRVVNDFHYFP